MGFFDRDQGDEEGDEEEVTLSVPGEEEENKDQGNLRDEAEARLTAGSNSDEEEDTSGMLPGMDSGNVDSGSDSSRDLSGEKESVDLKDIHRQNKQIKSILKDIRSEIKDEGDIDGVL